MTGLLILKNASRSLAKTSGTVLSKQSKDSIAYIIVVPTSTTIQTNIF